MPEVTLGLIPGAGGTLRLPRLIGLAAALGMIGSGEAIDCERAAELGLIDAIAEDPRSAAHPAARGLLGTDFRSRSARRRAVEPQAAAARQALIREARGNAARLYPWSTARATAIASVETGLSASFEEALVRERSAFQTCARAPDTIALFHQFFAERTIGRVPGLDSSAAARLIEAAAVIGAGTMGRGIAIALARARMPVTLIETDPRAGDRARQFLDEFFEREVHKGRLAQDRAREMRERIVLADDLSDASQADLIIEAAYEERGVKRQIFAALDRLAKASAILATNTSSLDVADIAEATRRPADVVGLHFFSPAHVMPLLEIVRTAETAPDVLNAVLALARRLRKTGVVVGNCFGFVANRMIFEYLRQAEFLVEEGSSPEQIDRVLKAYGLPMGPFEMIDMAGLDVGWRIRKDRAHLRPAEKRYSILADLLCEAGWFGQKTGKGWYSYGEGARDRGVNTALAPLIERARHHSGIVPRPIGDDEIADRCLLALVNEGARILSEGHAACASDIDVIYVAGFGYPRHRGGPMFAADQRGLDNVLMRIREFERSDPHWWKPAKLLSDLAGRSSSFSAWDKDEEERNAWAAKR